MNKWPYRVKETTQVEIKSYVSDQTWQTFRLSLKGKSTKDKLKALKEYRLMKTCKGTVELSRADEVRIDNYINALKRGGQLNMRLEVVK